MLLFRLMAKTEELHFCAFGATGTCWEWEGDVGGSVEVCVLCPGWWQVTPPALSSLRCHMCHQKPADHSESVQLFIFNLLLSLPHSFFLLLLLARFPPTMEHLCLRLFPPDRSGCIFSSSVPFVTTQGVTVLWWLGPSTVAVVGAASERKSAMSSWWWSRALDVSPCLLHRQIRVSFMCRSHQERKMQRSGGMTPPLWLGDPAQHQLIVLVCASKSWDGDNSKQGSCLEPSVHPLQAPCGSKCLKYWNFW